MSLSSERAVKDTRTDGFLIWNAYLPTSGVLEDFGSDNSSLNRLNYKEFMTSQRRSMIIVEIGMQSGFYWSTISFSNRTGVWRNLRVSSS